MSNEKVRGCETCKHMHKSDNEVPCSKCVRNATDNYEPQTNYDLIKAMPIPEMVEVLKQHIDCQGCTSPCTANFCADKLEKWLESEVET